MLGQSGAGGSEIHAAVTAESEATQPGGPVMPVLICHAVATREDVR